MAQPESAQRLSGRPLACVGAGPASLFFAIFARRLLPERAVTVFERQPEGVTLGWGVVFPAELLDALDVSDPVTGREVRKHAFRWRDMVVDVRGDRSARIPLDSYSMGRHKLLEILVSRARQLGVTLRFESEITDPSQLADYELVIVGDGVRSMLRDNQRPSFGTKLRRGGNKYTWLGTSRVFDSFTFPFVETAAGWLWAHAYGFDDSTSTFIVETSSETWTKLGFDRLPTDETMRRLEGLFAPWLAGHSLRPQAGTLTVAPWLEFQTVTNARWHHGRLVLLGDAAHTTHFTIGSGTWLAFGDAASLAKQLAEHSDPQAALVAYEHERSAALRTAQLDAHNSERWFESLPRYIERDVQRFTELFDTRRSSLLPLMPPALFLQLREVVHRAPLVLQPASRLWRALQGR